MDFALVYFLLILNLVILFGIFVLFAKLVQKLGGGNKK